MLPIHAFHTVIAAMVLVPVVLVQTASWETPTFYGLPLLDQMIQITHGSWVSATDAWAAALRLTTSMSVV